MALKTVTATISAGQSLSNGVGLSLTRTPTLGPSRRPRSKPAPRSPCSMAGCVPARLSPGRERDAFLLRHSGDDPGPPGRLLVAWRELDRPAPLADDFVLRVAETLQTKVDDALRAAIADVQQLAVHAAPFAAAQAARVVVAHRAENEANDEGDGDQEHAGVRVAEE